MSTSSYTVRVSPLDEFDGDGSPETTISQGVYKRSPASTDLITARSLIETINSSATLTQEELFPLFSRASLLVNDSVRLLVQENSYIQSCIINLAAEVAANLDRNKAIYRRPVEFVSGVLKDVPADSDKREADFLCSCMDLQASLVRGDKKSQIDIVFSLPLTRMVFEQFIKEWHRKTHEYEYNAYLSTHLRLLGEDPSEPELVCYRIENECGLNARSAFGVIRYISLRLEALSSIYERIFNAYSRVILKQAKGQAVSEDSALDNFQNGSFGLLRAISSYDNVSNARFVGHAKWWIRQSMLYYLKEDSNLIRVSSNTWQHYAKLEAIRHRQESRLGPLTDSQLSDLSGYSKSHVESVYSTVRTSQVKSLDYPLRWEGNSTVMNVSPLEDESEDPADYTASDSVKCLLDNLSFDLRNLVCLAYGLTEYVVQPIPPDKVEEERLRQISVNP